MKLWKIVWEDESVSYAPLDRVFFVVVDGDLSCKMMDNGADCYDPALEATIVKFHPRMLPGLDRE